MLDTLAELRKKVVIGFVGGSDLSKQVEQLGANGKCMTSKVIIWEANMGNDPCSDPGF